MFLWPNLYLDQVLKDLSWFIQVSTAVLSITAKAKKKEKEKEKKEKEEEKMEVVGLFSMFSFSHVLHIIWESMMRNTKWFICI